ncbi:hypothetical protein GCM10027059_45090 [Myceligenerans halotolerans]
MQARDSNCFSRRPPETFDTVGPIDAPGPSFAHIDDAFKHRKFRRLMGAQEDALPYPLPDDVTQTIGAVRTWTGDRED